MEKITILLNLHFLICKIRTIRSYLYYRNIVKTKRHLHKSNSQTLKYIGLILLEILLVCQRFNLILSIFKFINIILNNEDLFSISSGLENIIANPWISMKERDIKSKLAKTKKQVNTVRNQESMDKIIEITERNIQFEEKVGDWLKGFL